MNIQKIFFCLLLLAAGFFYSCKKTTFTTSPDALLFTSEDTLHFDTVFTTVGSITQSFKIFNPNDQKLLVSNIELSGGNNSVFKINVDGSPGVAFSNIEIAPNDSIYVFVNATIDPNNATNPFLIQDSIKIEYNSNTVYVQLDAYGQNAHFLHNAYTTQDTSWSNELPFVIFGSFNVNEGNTLNIAKGTRIYFHAGASMNVNGTLVAKGEAYDSTRILFTGDRLDDYYNSLPASWGGIVFSETSKNNVLEFAIIKNATNGIVVDKPSVNANPKLQLQECVIFNASNAGLLCNNTSVDAINCLVANCGSNINIAAGGNYNFTNCTDAAYSNSFVSHQTPVLSISNTDSSNQAYPLTANFTNSIFWGDGGLIQDEILVQQWGSGSFDLNFTKDLYKGNPSGGNFTDCLQDIDPSFVTIDTYNGVYDFHLQEGSPCINAGKNAGVLVDLDGNARDSNTDIGCYEFK